MDAVKEISKKIVRMMRYVMTDASEVINKHQLYKNYGNDGKIFIIYDGVRIEMYMVVNSLEFCLLPKGLTCESKENVLYDFCNALKAVEYGTFDKKLNEYQCN